MGDIDGDLAFFQAADHLPAKRAQPRVCLFQTAVADEVPRVVGQLKHPDPEGVEGVDEIDIGLDRVAALKMKTDGELAVLLGLPKICGGSRQANRVLAG